MSDGKNVVMENVDIIFRNFSGKESEFNREGDRNFAILLSQEIADAMAQDGWNVKQLKAREDADEGEEPGFFLPVKVKYGKGSPPRVVLITSRGRENLSEDQVEMLDWVDIVNVDLIFRPYEWSVNGKTGISAYLQDIYVKIDENPLERKYAELEQ